MQHGQSQQSQGGGQGNGHWFPPFDMQNVYPPSPSPSPPLAHRGVPANGSEYPPDYEFDYGAHSPYSPSASPSRHVHPGQYPPHSRTHVPAHKLLKPDLYKTELCRSFQMVGHCRYGIRCQFAHGADDLRPKPYIHPLYKTQPCKNYQSRGDCPYGHRCRFIHPDDDKNVIMGSPEITVEKARLLVGQPKPTDANHSPASPARSPHPSHVQRTSAKHLRKYHSTPGSPLSPHSPGSRRPVVASSISPPPSHPAVPQQGARARSVMLSLSSLEESHTPHHPSDNSAKKGQYRSSPHHGPSQTATTAATASSMGSSIDELNLGSSPLPFQRKLIGMGPVARPRAASSTRGSSLYSHDPHTPLSPSAAPVPRSEPLTSRQMRPRSMTTGAHNSFEPDYFSLAGNEAGDTDKNETTAPEAGRGSSHPSGDAKKQNASRTDGQKHTGAGADPTRGLTDAMQSLSVNQEREAGSFKA